MLAIIIFLVIVLFLLVQMRSVQTYLAKRTSTYLSSKLKTRVEIGNVEIDFFKRIILNDVYIEDLHKDTLLYSKKLKIGIQEINLKNHKIYLKDIILLNAKYKLIHYKSDEDLNLQFIIDAFATNDTSTTTKPSWDIRCSSVMLVNTDFTYHDEHDTSKTSGINYVDLRTRNVDATFTDLQIDKDTIKGSIEYLSAVEKSGFVLHNLSSTKVKVSPVGITMKGLKIKTNDSDIETNLTFKYNRYSDFLDFVNKVEMKAEFNNSIIEMNDISYFAPQLKSLYKNVTLTGKITGTVSDLRGKKMDIYIGGITHFVGDVTLTGLPTIDETLIYLNIESLTTNYSDLKKIPIPPFNKQTTLDVPINILKLGDMKFKGTFTGLYNDFYAYGNFSSALGTISSDLSVSHDRVKNKEFYKGKIKSKAFDFGKFFNIPILGKVTANVDVEGSGLTLESLTATLTGNINNLDFNNYTYKNIAVEGSIAKQVFKGTLNVNDENIDFDFNGNIDFTEKLPKLDFVTTLNKADLGALHFITTTKKTNLSTKLIIDVTGSNIDNLIGQLNFDHTVYTENEEVYKLNALSLESKQENEKKSIRLASDFLDAKIQGVFKVLDLPETFQGFLNAYLPSYFKKTASKNTIKQNFDYDFLFKKSAAVTRLFIPELTIAPNTFFKGNFNSDNQQFNLSGNSSKISVGNMVFKNCNVTANTNDDLDFNLGCEKFFTSDSIWLRDFNIITQTNNDTVNIGVNWDNKSEQEYRGDMNAFLNFKSNKIIQFKILPSKFVISDSVWVINKANIVTIDSNYVSVSNLTFDHGNQSIALNGLISENKKDQLKLGLTNFNLSNLNLFTKPYGLNFKGNVNGESTITDLYHDMIFLNNNNFNNFYINDNEIGNGDIESVWDKTKEALYLRGTFSLGIVPNILFSGYYYPKKQVDNLDMHLNLQAMQMQIFEPFLKDYCSNFKGFFDGNVTIKGALDKPLISGIVNVNAKKVTVSYLNTTYNFSHSIVIENNYFGIENMEIFDMNHNIAKVTGKLYHDNFKNFQLDFDINATKFMCLNTSEINNQLFYGKAYTTGIINISGFADNILIAAKVKTEKITSADKSDKFNLLSKTEITKLYIPLSATSEVGQNDFITFVKKDTSTKSKNMYNLGGLSLDLDVDFTPDAEIQLVFDQKVGDIIKAKGNGTIKLNINTKGDFKMYGDYVITNGDYLFTLQNIINKRFDIENGSTIKWTGIPYDADVNINAIYKAHASLKPFYPEDSTGVYKKRYPVDLKLKMLGDLMSPEINFNLGLPTVDAGTRQTVLSYINTDAEMNRQVFSLLILNSFVTPYQLTSSGGGVNVGSAGASNTSEMLSNQLSNMLSKISNDFDIGVHYRPGDAISKNELEVALSTQLFNDKLSIESNLGVNNNATATQKTNNIVGDVNIEYKLTDDGKVRVKTFNKTNDNSQTYSSGPYTQGVGIFYREEFDTIGDLFNRYLNSVEKRKKKKITAP